MSEYTDAYAEQLQARAFDGDLDAADELLGFVRGIVMKRIRSSPVASGYHEDMYHDFVVWSMQRVASGLNVPMWRSWCLFAIRRIIHRHVERECKKHEIKEGYMKRRVFRINEAYPKLRECVAALPRDEGEMIHRLYFAPVRQNVLEYSREFMMSYWRARKMHHMILDKLRGWLVECGVLYA